MHAFEAVSATRRRCQTFWRDIPPYILLSFHVTDYVSSVRRMVFDDAIMADTRGIRLITSCMRGEKLQCSSPHKMSISDDGVT